MHSKAKNSIPSEWNRFFENLEITKLAMGHRFDFLPAVVDLGLVPVDCYTSFHGPKQA